VSDVSKHLVLAEAEEGESQHSRPFPPIVWLTIGDVFFNSLSRALCPGNTPAGTRRDLVMAMGVMEAAVAFFFLSLHKTSASLFFFFSTIPSKRRFFGPYSGAACHAFSAL